jgi:hypothetical protein
MNRQDQIQNSATNKKPSRERSVATAPELNEFEERLAEIGKQIEELRTSPGYSRRAHAREECAPADDLQVKAEAARWMLRVAKHLVGPTREKVLSTVERSLDDLEKLVVYNYQSIAGETHSREAHAASR